MTAVLCDTELRHLLPRPTARVVGREYSVHFSFLFHAFEVRAVYAFKQVAYKINLFYFLFFPWSSGLGKHGCFLLCRCVYLIAVFWEWLVSLIFNTEGT